MGEGREEGETEREGREEGEGEREGREEGETEREGERRETVGEGREEGVSSPPTQCGLYVREKGLHT